MTTTNRMPAPPTRPPMQAPSQPPARGATPPLASPWATAPSARDGNRVLVYGQGGLGKSRLCCAAPGPVLVFDWDESLATLWKQLNDEQRANVRTYVPESWGDFISKFEDMSLFAGIQTIVVDTATMAERKSEEWVKQNIPNSKGGKVSSIEDYGFKIGYRHVFDQWVKLLAIADRHRKEGRNIVFVAHAENTNTANPNGEDFLRVEPSLQKSAQGNIRNRIYEWVDYCLYMDIDKAVNTEGKVSGGNSRTIYTFGQPWFMAKQRGNAPEMIYPDVAHLEDVWSQLFA